MNARVDTPIPPMKRATSNMLAHALWLAKKGVFVIPLCWPVWDEKAACWVCGCGRCKCPKDVGKRPLLGNGYQAYRADLVQIEKWWGRWPDANIGILLEPSGLVVADLDSEEARQEVRELGIFLTRVASTGRGLHYYYRRPEDCPARRRIGQGRSGKIDILAKGYVVAPPSRHQSGDWYQWRGGPSAVDPPDWMVCALQDTSGGGLWSLVRDSSREEKRANAQIELSELLEQDSDANIGIALEKESSSSGGFSFEPLVVRGDFGCVKEECLAYQGGTELAPTRPYSEEEEIWEALGWIPAEDYELWLHVGMALHYWDHRGEGKGRGRLLWDRWSEWGCAYKFDLHSQEKTWRSFGADRGIQVQKLFSLADEFRKSYQYWASSAEHDAAFLGQKGPGVPQSREGPLELSGWLEVGVLRLHRKQRVLALGEGSCSLTPSELEIIELLMLQAGRAVLFESFFEHLYRDENPHIKLNLKGVLRQYMYRLRSKVEDLGGKRGWICNIRGSGYSLEITSK